MMLRREVAPEVVSDIGQCIQYTLILVAAEYEVLGPHGPSRQAQMTGEALVALQSVPKTDHRDIRSHGFRPKMPLLQPVPRLEPRPEARC